MKNRFYVGEQPEKTILSVVVIDEIPVSEEAHNRLYDLQEVSDLLFIIPKEYRMGILAKKFGSLYRACCWVEAEGDVGEAFMESLEYDAEIFGNHVLILITQVSNITELGGEGLQKIAASSISKPIFQTRRLTSQEFYAIYKDDNKEQTIKSRFFPTPPDMSNLFTTHVVTSRETLIRPWVVDKMLSFWKSVKEDGFSGEGYVCSFRQPTLDYILASMLKRLKLGKLEVNPNEL